VPFIEKDELMYPHMETLRRLLAEGKLVAGLGA
jgi:hypothetical protein